jgi:hypothetical protein
MDAKFSDSWHLPTTAVAKIPATVSKNEINIEGLQLLDEQLAEFPNALEAAIITSKWVQRSSRHEPLH